MPLPDALVDRLLSAIRETWSGAIIVSTAGEPVGQVVLKEGRFAWATCKGQTETLGIFLWRMGRLTKEQLAEVQRTFKAHGGKKKLGIILEESGLMSHQILRRCLLLHTRSAVEALLSIPEAHANFETVDQPSDERFLFGPEEVLPQELSRELFSEWVCPENHHSRSWRTRTAQNAILEEITDLPGCLLAAVISRSGDIMTAYTGEDIDLDVLSVHVSTLLENSARLAKESLSGDLNCTILNCEQRQIIACWLDAKQRYAGFVLAEKDEQALIQINECMTRMKPKLYEWLAKGHELELQMVNVVAHQVEIATAPPVNPAAEEPSEKAENRPEEAVRPARAPVQAGRAEEPLSAQDIDIFALVRRNLQTFQKQNAFDLAKGAPPRAGSDPFASGALSSVGSKPADQAPRDLDIFSEVRRSVGANSNEPDIFSEVRRNTADIFSEVRPRQVKHTEQSAFSLKRGTQEKKSDAFAIATRAERPKKNE